MYQYLLVAHSFIRWLVVISLVIAVIRAGWGWRKERVFSAADNKLRHWTATIAHIQLMLGLGLYFLSPLTAYFMQYFKDAVHQREFRFFGMEHSLVMIVAVVLITVGSAKAKRAIGSQQQFKTMALWYGISFLLILSSIPWKFSPLVSRPYLRWF